MLVQEKEFIRFEAIPMPVNDKIAYADHRFIIANIEARSILNNDAKLIELNETLSITEKIKNQFGVVHEDSDCVLAKLFGLKGKCKWVNLPEKYYVWFETPAHNIFVFHSNVEKHEICNGDEWNKIEESSGIINLNENCKVKTENRIIFAQKDKTNVEKRIFKIEKSVSELDNEMKNETMTKLEHIKLQSLDDVKRHVQQLEQLDLNVESLNDNSIVHWSLWGLLFILTAGFFIWYKFVRQDNVQTEENQRKSNNSEEHEMKEIKDKVGIESPELKTESEKPEAVLRKQRLV